ncbi:DUF2730 family protein [Salipiger abyssi]|uniref:DUF2730 family protein n=1 Tax=Salipiger abyssi TaxID=1250539 RepID=UPI00081A32F5|nr:DUF2730 family protein [Salipiger abyssi]ALF02119.1 hypothetical protein vBPeaSP1_028 [Pelagibaca phage vB_PeaS-P1]
MSRTAGRAALLFTLALIAFALSAAVVLAQGVQSPPASAASMTLDLAFLQRMTGLLGFVISVAAMLYTFFANRRKDVERRFHEGSKRMDRHDLRLQALEQDVKGMPGKEDLHRLELALVEMSGDMRAMTATMDGLAKSVTRTETAVTRHERHLSGETP